MIDSNLTPEQRRDAENLARMVAAGGAPLYLPPTMFEWLQGQGVDMTHMRPVPLMPADKSLKAL